jgi:sn-glycerol 3-phosphate transport system permease protein
VRRALRRYPAGESLAALLCLAPSLAIFGIFYFYPLYRLFILSGQRSNSFGTRTRWVGFSQLGDVLTGSEFRNGIVHSLQYMVFTVPLGLVLGLLHLDVLNNPRWALFAVSWVSTWQNIGLSFIIVLAGLQAVPEELLEAATIDGHGPVRRFFKVTLPLLSPVLVFLTVVLVIFAMQAYAPIDILTHGAPTGSTETLLFKVVQNQQPAQVSTGAALSIGLFGVTLLITLAQYALLTRRVHYGR